MRSWVYVHIGDDLWHNYAHRWHSGEFSTTIMEQSKFWRRVIEELGVESKSPLTIEALPE